MPEPSDKKDGKKKPTNTKDTKDTKVQGRDFLVVDRSLRPDTWHTEN